jgi:hypothetical protein
VSRSTICRANRWPLGCRPKEFEHCLFDHHPSSHFFVLHRSGKSDERASFASVSTGPLVDIPRHSLHLDFSRLCRATPWGPIIRDEPVALLRLLHLAFLEAIQEQLPGRIHGGVLGGRHRVGGLARY